MGSRRAAGGWEHASVRMLATGKVEVITGTSPHGQGHETAWSQIVADRLGVAFEDVEVLHGDTQIAPKGVGEAGTIASTPAVVNAVVDALRPFGVRDVRMPCTPERIWKAIHDAGGGGAEPTEPGATPHFDQDDVADRSAGRAQS